MDLTNEMKYQLLLEISQRVHNTLDLDIILDQILDTLQTILPYDAAGIFALNKDLRSLEYGPARHIIAGVAQRGFQSQPADDDPMFTQGKGMIGYVIQSGKSLVEPDVRQNPHYVAGRQATLSEIVVPIILNQRVIGALNVESDQLNAFDLSHLEVLSFFADAAAISIEKALLHRQIVEKELLEKQLETACAVQQRLLPEGSPGIPGYDIAGVCIPAEEVGGDYFDYIQLPLHHLGVGIADVSGHGISAALVMTAFRALLRTHARSQSQPTNIAQAVNRELPDFTGSQHFVTALYVVLSPTDGRLEYVNCGHPAAVVLRTDGRVDSLDRRGPALGVFTETDYPTAVTWLNPGDLAVLYTDGVVEVEDQQGVRFGVERLVDALQQNRHLPADEIAEWIVQATKTFSGSSGYRDDFTLVLLKRKPG